MARYEHLPIYKAAFDLAVHMEKLVKNFSRYHKYTLGTELRNASRAILERIIEANDTPEKRSLLLELRHDLERFKVLSRLCHESGGFSGTRAYLNVSEKLVGISKQNEGWLKATGKAGRTRAKGASAQGRPSERGVRRE